MMATYFNNNRELIECFRRLKALYNLTKSMHCSNTCNYTNQWYINKQTKHTKINKHFHTKHGKTCTHTHTHTHTHDGAYYTHMYHKLSHSSTVLPILSLTHFTNCLTHFINQLTNFTSDIYYQLSYQFHQLSHPFHL